MTDVIEPVYVYARDPHSRRVVTVCYTIQNQTARVGLAVNHPDDCFEKKKGREVAHGRWRRKAIYVGLSYVRARERYCELLDKLTDKSYVVNYSVLVDPLIRKVIARAKTEEIIENRIRSFRRKHNLPPSPETFRPVFAQDLVDNLVHSVREIESKHFWFDFVNKGFEKLEHWMNGGKR